MLYRDRVDAGKALARLLKPRFERKRPIVLGLARGGVPVASAVAGALGAPLDVFVVRKLGFPGQEEFAMGAVASGGIRVLNDDAVGEVRPEDLERETRAEFAEIERRELAYRDGRPPLPLAGRDIIVVDDGLATGSSMLAAVRAIRQSNPASITIAVPVASQRACHDLEREADAIVCGMTPEPFWAVGQWYQSFAATPDDEVRDLLARASASRR